MADTFSQVHLHFIFTPKFRASLINPAWETDLHKYITGITRKNAHKMLAINGTADHVHMLVGFQTTQSIAAFMQDVKADSSQWINQNKLCKTRFEWQAGYKSQRDTRLVEKRNQRKTQSRRDATMYTTLHPSGIWFYCERFLLPILHPAGICICTYFKFATHIISLRNFAFCTTVNFVADITSIPDRTNLNWSGPGWM